MTVNLGPMLRYALNYLSALSSPYPISLSTESNGHDEYRHMDERSIC